jgi:chemotaxis protein histidine kinase CheA
MVRAGHVPVTRQATRTGFRYLVPEGELDAIAAAIAGRRKASRPGDAASEREALKLAQDLAETRERADRAEMDAAQARADLQAQLAEVRADRDAWRAQAERLGEALTRLALPEARPEPATVAVMTPEPEAGKPAPGAWASWWTWFTGRKR